jgi:hemoglobin-like flavoprotein
MTPSQIIAVQCTFSLVVPIKDKAAELFYNRLFSIDPSAKRLFKGDMADQGRKLMTALATVVAGLADIPRVIPVVRELGRRHAGYGVQDSHYDSVGAALLWTLEQGLGKEFTPEVRDAWTKAYTLIASEMKSAGNRAGGEAAA